MNHTGSGYISLDDIKILDEVDPEECRGTFSHTPFKLLLFSILVLLLADSLTSP